MTDPDPFEELWVRLEDGQAMCALINGSRGWLMYLREPGDAGMSSRNPSYRGDENEQIEYRLSNGQRDLYPASWALDIGTLRRALELFKDTGALPDFVTWHDDSAEGEPGTKPSEDTT